jgi:dTDP-4-dehydrorhamnose reductase
MHIHLIGSNGYIGRKLISFLDRSTPVSCYSRKPGLGDLNIELTKPDIFDFARISAGDFVIFLAAISSPDICEKQIDYAYTVNVRGTREFIARILERKANLLFFSSDAVLGATKNICDENTSCCPLGNYAKMKKEIEEIFINFMNFKIFRLSYVFSKEDRFTNYLHQCYLNGQTAEVFDALRRNVIYLYDILDAIQRLGKKFSEFKNQIFHLAGPELLSRKDMAVYYKQIISPGLRYNIVEPPKDFFNVRPDIIETKSLYLTDLLGRSATPFNIALAKEYHKNESVADH